MEKPSPTDGASSVKKNKKQKKSYKGTCKLSHSSSYKVTTGRFATDVIHTWNSRLQEGEAEKIFFFFPKESAMRTTLQFHT